MKKTILVTGSSGFIGQAFIRNVAGKYRIIGIDKVASCNSDCEVEIISDICDIHSMQQVFLSYPIDIVVHTAAEKSLVICEKYQRESHNINVCATQNLHELAMKYGAKFIFISSDQVFDGNTGYYTEDSERSSINYYGKMKIQAEDLLKKDPTAAICRTALVFGDIPPKQQLYFEQVRSAEELAVQGYIVQQTRFCLENDMKIHLPQDEYISPTHTSLLSDQIEAVIKRNVSGILHCCGADRISRYEMGLQIAKYYGLNPFGIMGHSGDNPLRPKDVSLNCQITEKKLGFHFLSFAESLVKYMQRDEL